MKELKEIYFVGIGGIGMSALARYFNLKGAKVSGYDRVSTDLTNQLQKEGIGVHFEENLEVIPKNPDLVVYTPAIPEDHVELKYYRDSDIKINKRSEVLGQICAEHFSIAVAGSHGKTTVSTIIAHVLKTGQIDCTAFLGGISVDYNTNFISGGGNELVVEADEYDRSFLQLFPDIAIITAIDTDHLDVYGDHEHVKESFNTFASQVKKGGSIVANHQADVLETLAEHELITYSLDDIAADFHAMNLHIGSGYYLFDVMTPDTLITGLQLDMGGYHNVENAVAGITVATILGVAEEDIKRALAGFQGVRRRFEYITKGDVVFVDDYAHHPKEIYELLRSVRDLYPESKITAIFQPHLFSRTKDLAEGFGKSLSLADEIILMDIYPAREEPIEGVNSQLILDKLEGKKGVIASVKEILKHIETNKPEVLLTIGAGDIDKIVEPIKEILNSK